MKIQSQGTALVLAKTSRDGFSNNKPTTYYNLAILLNNNEAGNISCSEEAYQEAVPNKTYILYYEFNSEYKTLRVVGVMPCDSVLASSTDAGAGTAEALNPEANLKAETEVKPEADKKGSKPDKPGK